MSHETHRCSVEGCPNLAAYEVCLHNFDLTEGAVLLRQDESCPFIYVDHAIANERYATGEPRQYAVRYPYTNREHAPGITVYRQQEAAHVA